MDLTFPTVRIELPQTWVRVPIAPDGDRAGQRALIADWCHDEAPDREPPANLVRRLVRESRRSAAEGVAFAAVLLATVDGHGTGAHRWAVGGSLTVGFRRAPGPPRVVAEGVLRSLRHGAAPTRRAELVGLAADPDRPAVLVQEQGWDQDQLLARTEVFWPVADQLAGLCVTTADLPLSGAMKDVALSVAASLSVEGVAPVNA